MKFKLIDMDKLLRGHIYDYMHKNSDAVRREVDSYYGSLYHQLRLIETIIKDTVLWRN